MDNERDTGPAPVPGRVLYLQYYNPAAFPPLEHSSGILARAGWEVSFLGVHSKGAESLTAPPHARIRYEVLAHTPPGWRQKIAYVRFLSRALRIAWEWKPAWIYVSDSLAAPAGVLLRSCLRCRTIYHEHDNPPTRASSWFMRMVLSARRRLARTADIVVLPQAERVRRFVAETATERPVYRVWNCPSQAEAGETATRVRMPGEPLGIYFHGSINLNVVPASLIEGARRCEFPVRIRIVGYETNGSVGTIDTLRAAAASADNVTLEFMGAVPRGELQSQMADMHVGWTNHRDRADVNLEHLAGASNKAFDYLAAGLPMIVPDAPDWEAIYVNAGYAKSCDAADPDSIATTLRWFYDHAVDAGNMGRRGQQRVVEEWNYESEFSKVLDVMSARTSPHPRARCCFP